MVSWGSPKSPVQVRFLAPLQSIFMSKKNSITILVLLGIICLFLVLQVYVPKASSDATQITYEVKRGFGDGQIAKDLKNLGVIKNSLAFRFYAVVSGQHRKLQAGTYLLSPSMSISNIVARLAVGDVVKNNAVIIEGWNLKEISQYLESKDYYNAEDFLALAKQDWSSQFVFLQDKPKKLHLEGYIFPDTYQVGQGQTAEEFIKITLENFDKKLTPELRTEIALQKKSIFEIITMASILEKEVASMNDKKMVSGILWKRLKNGIGLHVDSTVNYITGNGHASVTIEDTKIDSPYNTYKYGGLPLGPISNPGMDSILAAIYPTASPYWYYLSADGTGVTIFSKTLDEHNVAVAKYLR